MAENSKIEWTHHTFNPWWGCTKVSPACRNCYAESWAVRVGERVWGSKAPRRFFGDSHWSEPMRWNRDAQEAGERRRVFCASMADVFERRKELNPWRDRLWDLIENTPWLDWLLLTKRPGMVGAYVPWGERWPQNVWLGTTVETQRWAGVRLPELVKYPAAVRFVSSEPLLGQLNLRPWLDNLDWVIAGGESGAKARPMNPAWARDLRDQCRASSVAFHFKQWGHWRPETGAVLRSKRTVQVFDESGRPVTLVRLDKKTSGRDLDGRTWDELPPLPKVSTS